MNVHTNNCCKDCGCCFNEEGCPVTTGEKQQRRKCGDQKICLRQRIDLDLLTLEEANKILSRYFRSDKSYIFLKPKEGNFSDRRIYISHSYGVASSSLIFNLATMKLSVVANEDEKYLVFDLQDLIKNWEEVG